jgi:hypothetical protein
MAEAPETNKYVKRGSDSQNHTDKDAVNVEVIWCARRSAAADELPA